MSASSLNTPNKENVPYKSHQAVLFSGQGSQRHGMGKMLAEADREAMDLWKLAEKLSGLPLREIYWDGDEAAQADTRAVQPALTVFNFNLWRKFRNQLNPFAMAGHSLGEFSALAASGALAPEDAISITALRGRLMAEADPNGTGAMAAIVRLPDSVVQKIVDDTVAESGEILVAANFNTPVQTVISGSKHAVEMAGQKAKQLKGRSVPLKVSGAFHSPLMAEANREFVPWLEKLDWRDPRIPVFVNAGAASVRTGADARAAIARQMISPVKWTDVITNLYESGARQWVEIGPRAVLSKMLEPILAIQQVDMGEHSVDILNSFQQGITPG